MKKIKVRVTFTEEVLGTSSNDVAVFDKFIASKAPDAQSKQEEIEALGVEQVIENGMTVFPREEGKPFIWDYQFKGFFKEACKMLRAVKGTKSSTLKAYKDKIDGRIFPAPRKIIVNLNGVMGECQRPLRASTAQGERIALAISETIPAGSTCEFEIKCLADDDIELVKEWLEYGELHGMLQWRNSGKGSFTTEILGIV